MYKRDFNTTLCFNFRFIGNCYFYMLISFLMPHANKEQAYKTAERIRRSFEDCKFLSPSGGSERKYLTVSMGVEELKSEYDSGQFIVSADKAMYQSKRLGGNTITIFGAH